MLSRSCPPVLLIIFNRPDLAGRVFEQIRAARPTRLFIAADGPRPDHPDDIQACRETRLLVEQVDWTCEVKTLFREKNLGCRLAVESAITWFFEHEEAGIILEDDCLPDRSFFPFCSELLERYKDNEQVMSISGDCFQPGGFDHDSSYSFSIYHHIWGWATWRRAWQRYDSSLATKPCLFDFDWLSKLLGSESAARYWERIITRYHAGQIDSWDYPWLFSCWLNSGLSIVPTVNLVTNIGFGPRGTHVTKSDSPWSMYPSLSICFPLKHPPFVQRDRAVELASENTFLPPDGKFVGRVEQKTKGKALLRRLLHYGKVIAGF